MDIKKYLIHESFGYKKIVFSENMEKSPKKFANNENKYVEVKTKRILKKMAMKLNKMKIL